MSSLGKNSLITLLGQGFKALFQGLAFILVARTLGAEDFGIFVAILAMSSMLSPFVDFGGYHLIVKRIAEKESLVKVTADTFGILFSSAPVFILFLCILTYGIYGYSLLLAVIIGLTSLLFDKLLSIFTALHISRDSFKIIAILETVSSALRFLFAVILYFIHGDVLAWVLLLFLQGAITSGIILWLVKREMQSIPLARPSLSLMKIGVPYVWNQVGGNANQDFDKICLSKISGADVAGIYGAVMRVLNIALIPIYAFYMAAYARYFRAAHAGTDGFKHALKMVVPSAFLGIVTSVFVLILAPYVPLVLGEEYEAAVELIKIAVIVPIVQTIANPFADTLSGYNKQTLRVKILFLSLLVNAILNLILIPDYAAHGALIATICSHLVFLFACAWSTYRLTKKMPQDIEHVEEKS